jgi:hypothetical protein
MKYFLKILFFTLLSFSSFANEKGETIVDLRNPTYVNGILYTNQGGVIQNKDIRIQAKTIQYFRRGDVHKIEAEGELLIQYKNRVFVGSELEYDFNTKSGIVYDGKTFSSIWYVGGDILELTPDGNYKVTNGFITTCENIDSSWDLHAGRVSATKDDLVEAKKVTVRTFKVPTLWLPNFRINLRKFKEPIFRYDLKWDSGMGPRAGIRYQLYSWRDFAFYGRVEYRWRVGWGGAIETDYQPSDSSTVFITKSYLAKDRLESAPNPARRYRVQGLFSTESKDKRTTAKLTWDKYSDVRMPGDFHSNDFEVNTAKKTLLHLNHRACNYVASFKFRPRANPFESIKQDLPTMILAIRPLQLGTSGIYSSNYLKASYLDFVYSDQLSTKLSSYHSPRIEFREKFYRPYHFNALTITPELGGVGIFYGNSPSSSAKWVGTLIYGAKAMARGVKQYPHYKHQIVPYAQFIGYSNPTVKPDNHYIFSIQDGYDKLNQLKAGVRSLLFSKKRPNKEASFTADLYVNAFFADFAIPQLIPYGYLNLAWRIPSLHFTWENAWNFRHSTLQHTNARLLWTVNENIAFSLEGRYRSRYDWRKADHESFFLDVSRREGQLLQSPLSDRRITFLTNAFFRLTPFWECHIQSHHGFFRINESPYNEIKINLYTWLSSVLKLRLTYKYTDYTRPNFPHHFGANLELVKK